jgi:hypothetical protein
MVSRDGICVSKRRCALRPSRTGEAYYVCRDRAPMQGRLTACIVTQAMLDHLAAAQIGGLAP